MIPSRSASLLSAKDGPRAPLTLYLKALCQAKCSVIRVSMYGAKTPLQELCDTWDVGIKDFRLSATEATRNKVEGFHRFDLGYHVDHDEIICFLRPLNIPGRDVLVPMFGGLASFETSSAEGHRTCRSTKLSFKSLFRTFFMALVAQAGRLSNWYATAS